MAECANILWKKQRSGELHRDEAVVAARLDAVCVSADRRLVRALGRPGRWRGRVVALA